jgi:hypothetical protein
LARRPIVVTTYAIKDWAEVFEDYRSREVARLQWLICRVLDRKSDAYALLVAREGGVEAYGVFWALVLIAARCPRRGLLVDDRGPLTIDRLAVKTRMPITVIARAIEMLTEADVGWLVQVDEPVHDGGAKSPVPSAHHPTTDGAPTAHRRTTDGAPTDHRRRTDGSDKNTDESRKNTDGPPTVPPLRTERARDKTKQNTTTTSTPTGAACAAVDDDGGEASPSEGLERRKAFFRKRPDWWPSSKPWISDRAVKELADLTAAFTNEQVAELMADTRRQCAGLTAPAGYLINRFREAAKTAGGVA